jgi:hypothetical protein
MSPAFPLEMLNILGPCIKKLDHQVALSRGAGIPFFFFFLIPNRLAMGVFLFWICIHLEEITKHVCEGSSTEIIEGRKINPEYGHHHTM